MNRFSILSCLVVVICAACGDDQPETRDYPINEQSVFQTCCECLTTGVTYIIPCYEGPTEQCTETLTSGLPIWLHYWQECIGDYCEEACPFLDEKGIGI